MTKQINEPDQKACIYKVMLKSHQVPDMGRAMSKFYQVRVKSIKFHEMDAIAIYFYDVTHHIESLKQSANALDTKN